MPPDSFLRPCRFELYAGDPKEAEQMTRFCKEHRQRRPDLHKFLCCVVGIEMKFAWGVIAAALDHIDPRGEIDDPRALKLIQLVKRLAKEAEEPAEAEVPNQRSGVSD